jgi:hypothetical protein
MKPKKAIMVFVRLTCGDHLGLNVKLEHIEIQWLCRCLIHWTPILIKCLKKQCLLLIE